MIVGTVVGVAQTNVKRMLAYSSIAHGGYLLVALVSANDVGKGAILFYLLAYAVTNLGAFGVIALLDTADRPNDQMRDYAGLWNEHPALAALMTIFLLSLGGFPPIGRLHRASGTCSAPRSRPATTWLAIIGVLTSVVSVFFYLRVVVMMYMTPTRAPARFPAVPRIAGAALVVSADPRLLPRHPADARARLGRGVDRDDLLGRASFNSRRTVTSPRSCKKCPVVRILSAASACRCVGALLGSGG